MCKVLLIQFSLPCEYTARAVRDGYHILQYVWLLQQVNVESNSGYSTIIFQRRISLSISWKLTCLRLWRLWKYLSFFLGQYSHNKLGRWNWVYHVLYIPKHMFMINAICFYFYFIVTEIIHETERFYDYSGHTRLCVYSLWSTREWCH